MLVVCFDLEGVLMPEVWINVAEKTGIEQLRRTTRDEPDYDKLMRYRLNILDEHGITIDDIQQVIATCLLYTSPSPRDATLSRMPSSA